MAQTTTIDGVARTGVIVRSECEWGESAYLGEIGQGRLRINDADGTISVVGHKTIVTEQSSTAAWPRLYTGFVGRKTMGRGETYVMGAGREITVTTKDGNDLLTRHIIRGTDGKRPAETVGERVAWILTSVYLTGLVADFGAVTDVTTLGMDATDYRGQRPGDVLAACAKKAQFNFYVRWHVEQAAEGSGWELVFRDDNASTADTSTITITNDGTANSTSSFAPDQDAEFTEDPEDVYSGAYAAYAKGTVYETRPATATAFVARDGATDDSGIKTAASATDEAKGFLWQSHLEEHTLIVTLQMRAAYVNLIRAGQRVAVTMTHLAQEGYDAGAYWRVLRRKVRQPLDTDHDYAVTLDLAPQEAAETFPEARIVQSAFGAGSEGGVTLTLPNPVTIGNLLVVWVADRGNQLPISPNTAVGQPRWGAGAWTRLNGASATALVSGAGYHGCAMYYKVADATDQTGWHAGSNVCLGIWEIEGGDIASATLVTKNEQSGAPPYTIGSLNTAATGSVALMGVAAGGEAGYQWEYTPLVSVTPGVWTERLYRGPYIWSFFDGPAYANPICWIGDTYGAGAALSASITRTPTHWSSQYFAGLALLIPPL